MPGQKHWHVTTTLVRVRTWGSYSGDYNNDKRLNAFTIVSLKRHIINSRIIFIPSPAKLKKKRMKNLIIQKDNQWPRQSRTLIVFHSASLVAYFKSFVRQNTRNTHPAQDVSKVNEFPDLGHIQNTDIRHYVRTPLTEDVRTTLPIQLFNT